MDKYKKLVSNTIIFAIGTFSSKALSVLIMPFVTRILNSAEFNSADLIQQTVNLLIPLVTLAVNSAALRFALDKATDKRTVFSTGVYTTIIGVAIFAVASPLLKLIKINDFAMGEYILIICVFLLVSSMRHLCQQFVRGMGQVRLYAIDGIIATANTIIFNVLYLWAFDWGVNGFILAIITSDFISICFMFWRAKLPRYLIGINKIQKSVSINMLKYCIPLVPTVILWWIINVSDRYMVTYFDGSAVSGLYAAASKIPNFVVIFSSIFIDAWQLSAVDEYDNEGRANFFTKVFGAYSGSIFAVASGLVLTCQLITRILVSNNYFSSWKFVPILILATLYSCLVNFLASVYMAEKKSNMAFLTAMAGAVTNIGLNFVLIPRFGPNGAAIATVISFMVVFIARAINTRKYIKFDLGIPRLIVCTVILLCQSFLMINAPMALWVYGVEALLTVIMVAINLKPLIEIITMLKNKFLKKRKSK